MSRFAVVLLLAPSLAAQVSPAGHKNVEGNIAQYLPLGNWHLTPANRQVRYMQIHSDVTKSAITRMVFRRDSRAAFYWNQPKFKVDLDVHMAKANVAPNQISALFAANISGTATLVVKRGQISFPAAPKIHGPGPQLAFYNIPLTTTYIPAKGSPIVWDMRCYGNDLHTSNPERNLYLDGAQHHKKVNIGHNGAYGRGCFSSNKGIVLPASTASAFHLDSTGRTLNFTVSGCNFTPSSSGLAMVGVSRTLWRGLPLPFGLGALGAPGCTLYQSNDLAIPVQMNYRGALGNACLYHAPGATTGSGGGPIVIGGNATLPTGKTVSTTHAAAMEGVTIYSQIYGTDTRANRLGLVFGSASYATVPFAWTGGFPVNRLYRVGATAFTAKNGIRNLITPQATLVDFR